MDSVQSIACTVKIAILLNRSDDLIQDVRVQLRGSEVIWNGRPVQSTRNHEKKWPQTLQRVLRLFIGYQLLGEKSAYSLTTRLEEFSVKKQKKTGDDPYGGNGYLKRLFGLDERKVCQFFHLFKRNGKDGWTFKEDENLSLQCEFSIGLVSFCLSQAEHTAIELERLVDRWRKPTDAVLLAIHTGIGIDDGKFTPQRIIGPWWIEDGDLAGSLIEKQPSGFGDNPDVQLPQTVGDEARENSSHSDFSRELLEASDHKEADSKTRLEVQKHVAGILMKHPKAAGYFAEKYPDTASKSADAKHDAIAGELLTTDLMTFLPLVRDPYAKCVREHDPIAEVFRDIATYVLPQIYGADFRRELRRCLISGDHFLPITTSHKSLFELIVAGVEGRHANFPKTWQFDADIPEARNEVARNAEAGFGDEVFIKEFEEALLRRLSRFAGFTPNPIGTIQADLEILRRDVPSTRLYYFYKKDQGRVPKLEDRYKDIVFVLHNSREDTAETHLLLTLRRLYCPEIYQ